MFSHLRSYQTEAANYCFNSNRDKIVLAASCSAGKTFISIAFIIAYLKKYKCNVIVLTHGTLVIKNNYTESVEKYFKLFPNEDDELLFKKYVTITLPQSYHKYKKKYGLLVIDEGHHYYFGEMVQDIIEKVQPKKQLILTGTPSKFNANKKKFDIYYIPFFELPSENISDVLIELATSTAFKMSYDDFNKGGELYDKTYTEISLSTDAILDDLLKEIYKKIKSVTRTSPRLYSFAKLPCTWTSILATLDKTIFACKTVDMAKRIESFFKKIKIDTLLSTSKEDVDSKLFKVFKEDPNYKILIIVQKGTLGFDFEDLGTIVDLTLSSNLDRIHQLLGRLLRKSDTTKFYFKVTTPEFAQWVTHIMTASILIGHRNWMTVWNGKNFQDFKVIVNNPTKNKKSGSGGHTKNPPTIKYFMEIPSLLSFKDLIHKDGSLLSSYKYARIGDIRKELHGIRMYWSLATAILEAKKYSTRKEFEKESSGAYDFFLNNYKEELNDIFSLSNIKWNLETATLEAKKYSTRKEFSENSGGAYNYLLANYRKELNIIFPYSRNYWNLETATLEAKKYSTRTDFTINCKSAYNWFMDNNLKKELIILFPYLKKYK